MSSSVESVNQSSSIYNISITINDFSIDKELIQDYAVNWEGFSIYGHLVINDIYDIINTTDLKPNDEIVISYTDVYDKLFARNYNIVSTYEKFEQDSKLLRINFRDVISSKLERIYIDKSYEETKLSEVFTEYFNKYAAPLISGYPINLHFENTTELRHKYCIPKDRNFLEFINLELYKEGYFLYQDKQDIYLTKGVTVPEHNYPYKQVPPHDVYGFNIISYRLKFNNLENKEIPRSKFFVYNPAGKTMDHYDETFSSYKERLKIVKNNITDEQEFEVTEKFRTQEYLVDNTYFYYYPHMNNSILEIVVPGNIEYSKIYRIMQVDMAGNRNSLTSQKTGNIKLSGKYKCFRVQDKLVNGKRFIQKLFLYRVEETPDIFKK